MITFGTLALIVAIGLLGPLLSRLPIPGAPPVVIGEIAAGVLIGRTGTRTLNAGQPTVAFLADIGFAILMFIVGTHLPVRDPRVRPALKRGLIAGFLTALLASIAAPAVAAASGLHRPAVVAVLLAASSAAVVLPIVETMSEISTPLLETIAWIAIVDTATIVAVPLVLATGSVGRAAIGAVLVMAGATLVGVIAARASAISGIESLRHDSHTLGWALDLRVSLLVLFALAWVAERFDTSVLIAGFAAGAVVAALGPPRRVAEQLIGLGEGFFVPLFFVVLGARIDFRALVHSGHDVKLLVLLSVVGTVVPVLVALIVRLPVAHGLLASARLGVPTAVASIGLASHKLTPGQGGAIVGAAAVSLAVASIGAHFCAPEPV